MEIISDEDEWADPSIFSKKRKRKKLSTARSRKNLIAPKRDIIFEVNKTNIATSNNSQDKATLEKCIDNNIAQNTDGLISSDIGNTISSESNLVVDNGTGDSEMDKESNTVNIDSLDNSNAPVTTSTIDTLETMIDNGHVEWSNQNLGDPIKKATNNHDITQKKTQDTFDSNSNRNHILCKHIEMKKEAVKRQHMILHSFATNDRAKTLTEDKRIACPPSPSSPTGTGDSEFDGSPPSSTEKQSTTKQTRKASAIVHCPTCQAPLKFNDDSLLDSHVISCMGSFVTPGLQCPKGIHCEHTSLRHFQSFGHKSLAKHRSGITSTSSDLVTIPKCNAPQDKPQNPRMPLSASNGTIFTGKVAKNFLQELMKKKSKPGKRAKSEAQKPKQSAKQEKKRNCPFYKRLPETRFTVDAFKYGSIDGCVAYFLTHFHSDHYGGLTSKFTGNIYCSEGTGNLVAGILNVPRSKIYPIPMYSPTIVDGVEVTLLDANHCPGAVVILFKLQSGKLYLHTGDFRASSWLTDHPMITGKRINILYLDTTYCDKKYSFPSQNEVLAFIVDKCREFVTENKHYIIAVGTYSIGKEKVFEAIAESLGYKAYVTPRKLKMLKLVAPDLLPLLTLDPTSTPLHVVPLFSLGVNKLGTYLDTHCQYANAKLLCFKPTGWSHASTPNLETSKPSTSTGGRIKVYNIPYSEHSSFAELEMFVKKIRPDKIIPTVNNGSATKRDEMASYFKQWMANH
eukprot:m.186748 g.186748  ORF g.186748 m.186748 type:complete len:736 (-) comp15596_c0_seq2:93-2300(-)